MRPLERFFYSYGRFLALHPWPFIIIPVLVTAISSYGFLFFHSQDDIWDIYAPIDGFSRIEEAALRPFEYASGSHHHRIQILVSRKDGGNILEKSVLEEIGRTNQIVTENTTATNGEKSFFYREMCGIYCNESNSAVIGFLKAIVDSEGQSSSLRLTFPNAEALQKKVFMGYSIGNLTYRKEEGRQDEVSSAHLFLLHYMVDIALPGGRVLADDFESKIRRFFTKFTENSPVLQFALLSRTREIEEQRKITLAAVPFLGLTTLVLTAFMVITMVDWPLYRSQHFESLIGVASPGMALSTSAGILFWIGFPFSNILTVVPFLVVTIGIDDAFLVLAGWRQSSKGESLPERMGQAISISGASVTVTSITDILSFSIGLFSNMPVVQLFCLYTTVALLVDYVYQMTLFPSVMSLIVRKQVEMDQKSITGTEEISSLEMLKVKLKESPAFFSMTTGPEINTKRKGGVEIFVGALHNRLIQILVLCLFASHVSISIFYGLQVNTDFDMENLYLEDSPLTDISRRMQNFMLKEAFVVNFAVRPLSDFSNETVRNEFETMVTRLESIPKYGAGPSATNFWMREFSNAIAFWGEEEDFWTDTELLKNYREYGMDEKYITTRETKEGEVMDGFFFSHAYHNMSSFLEVSEMMRLRREILAEYPQFHVISHHPFEKVPTESAASAPSNFLQTVVSAVILMSVLVLLFVMDIEAIISVVTSIVSICCGVVAYLHIWNVHLDAVSLISILMSIGFSVDYSAHVCYHYFAHVAEEAHSEANKYSQKPTYSRILSTLNGVGWPVVQSGLSTIIGMFPLMFVHAYVVAVFWKTVILVGLLGMLHALLLLPVIFILTYDIKLLIKKILCR